MSHQQCPLCLSDRTRLYHKASPFTSLGKQLGNSSREFQRCNLCDLTFVPPGQFITKSEEESHYNCHQNLPDDPGYRHFLNKVFEPLNRLLVTGARGLDYGSGPGPTLSVMFEEQGHAMNIYDYIFAPDDNVLSDTYDFITCTETVEHFRTPRDDLFKIWNILKEGGYLGIMTKFLHADISFPDWHYKNDPTHICFYSAATIEWLSELLKATVVHQETDVVIFQKT